MVKVLAILSHEKSVMIDAIRLEKEVKIYSGKLLDEDLQTIYMDHMDKFVYQNPDNV